MTAMASATPVIQQKLPNGSVKSPLSSSSVSPTPQQVSQQTQGAWEGGIRFISAGSGLSLLDLVYHFWDLVY